MKKLLFLSIAIIFYGCGNEKKYKELSYSNDLEQISGWFESPLLVKGPAHSGSYSYLVDSVHNYGLTFKKIFPDISTQKLKKIKFSAWFYVNDINAGGKLVVAIQDSNHKDLSWTGPNSHDFITKAGEWAQVKGEVDIPSSIPQTKDYYVMMYGWNEGKLPFWIDDMEISFE